MTTRGISQLCVHALCELEPERNGWGYECRHCRFRMFSQVAVMSHPTAPPELPPSYDEAQRTTEAPPSYDELFGEFRRVDSPSGLARFVKKAVDVIADTVAAAVVLALLNIIPILMIVLGSLNRERCPINSNIPLWLIVAGICALTRSAINFVYRFRDQQNRVRPVLVRLFESLLSIFILVWFILGSVWVYWAYGHVSFDQSSGGQQFCDQVSFMFSFIFITVTYALAILSCFCFCCCCCCICFRKPDHETTIRIAP